MKKIVAIIGSPKPSKQSVTYMVTNNFIDALKKTNNKIESEIIYLNQKNIISCTGCLSCQQIGKCVINDDMEVIVNHMLQADVLIFGSPVHFGFVSSTFQNFIERSLIHLHTFKFLGKPFINVITTNGSGEKETDQYLSKIGYLFGGIKIGSILKSHNDAFNTKAYHRIVLKTSSVLAGNKVRPKLINQLYFSSMKDVIKKNKDYFKAETEIWEKKNWLNKSFKEIFIESKN